MTSWRFRSFCDHGFQILPGHHQARTSASVQRAKERDEIGFESGLAVLVQGEKRFVDGPIVGPEHVDPVLGRSITKRERPGCMLDARRRREELAQVSIRTPQERRADARNRR